MPLRNALTRWMRAALVLALASCGGLDAGSRVQLVPIVVDAGEPERTQFGALTLMAAFELNSSDPRLGGISGLAVRSGNRLYAVSDRGNWLAAEMVLSPDGALQDLVNWGIAPLLAPDNTVVRGLSRDAEALAAAPGGSFIVGFEQSPRLWRYPSLSARQNSPPVPLPVPPELAEAPKNGGIEAVAVLPDGRIVVLTEEFQNPDGTFKGWLIDGGRFDPVSYQPSRGYNVSDCAALSNGDLLVLERSYTLFGGLRARLKWHRADQLRAGARLAGEEILRLEPPLITDNFEGLAVHEDSPSQATVYLVSDNNFHPLQRTLLLQFRWRRTL